MFQEILERMYQRRVVSLSNKSNFDARAKIYKRKSSAKSKHLQCYELMECEDCYFVVEPYYQYTLDNVITYSPSILNTSHAKLLFVVYQILQNVDGFHSKQLPVGDFKLNDMYVDKNLWISHFRFNIENCYSAKKNITNCTTSKKTNKTHHNQATDLKVIAKQWVQGEISNFNYLMKLNELAGRRYNDPNNHPILPWVMDFSSEHAGYRDLTKSKYRINKGDPQLDLTFNGRPLDGLVSHDQSISTEPAPTPHHISDVLSDITYFVYKARQTSKNVLCANVRSKWVPNEYPASMQRMQQWTPDECIPEFYMDPEIFLSIHDDLPDLEIPHWASSREDFIKKHLAVLEGDYVSKRLHHWIDLTFGYKVCSF